MTSSALLFILAYDPLLTRLATIPGTDVWAFADDAVIGNKSMHMTHITAEIDAFGEVSGFGVNRDKSSILHTMPPTDQHHTHLTNIGWEGLSFTTSATYLGILLGVGIGNDDVYRSASDLTMFWFELIGAQICTSSCNLDIGRV